MLELKAEIFAKWIGLTGITETLLAHAPTIEGWKIIREMLDELHQESVRVGFRSATTQIDKIYIQIGRTGIPASDKMMLTQMFVELSGRIKEEMQHPLLLLIPATKRAHFENPKDDWVGPLKRYKDIIEDVEEAERCFATDRFTACVFHLMRIVERAVLELEWILGAEDPKAHFGSVLSKLENLTQKAKYQDLPEQIKPHIAFLKNVLPHLHAVNDAWRNRVSHVGTKILPTDSYGENCVIRIRSATIGLMEKLARLSPEKPE